jgi:hypothetical protein
MTVLQMTVLRITALACLLAIGANVAVADVPPASPARRVYIRGKVAISTPRVVTGPLSADEISARLKTQASAFRVCFERKLQINPTLNGRVRFDVLVRADGSVSRADVDEDTIGDSDPKVAACALDRLRTVRFSRGASDSRFGVALIFLRDEAAARAQPSYLN